MYSSVFALRNLYIYMVLVRKNEEIVSQASLPKVDKNK